jgi:hypothetical protein
VKFTIYELGKCGFYQRGIVDPLFGKLGDWWQSFVNWTGSREIKDTKTSQSSENADEKDILGVYCANAFTSTNNDGFGLVLWNEVPHVARGVLSIPGSKKVGIASANVNRVNEGEIPGWPSHFWLCPGENLVVTLNPEARATLGSGIKHFEEYLRDFLKYWSHYCVTSKNENGEIIDIAGWKENVENSNIFNTPPSLKINRIKLPGELDVIKEKCGEIYKYVSHIILDYEQEDHRNLWQRFWSMRNHQKHDLTKNDKIQFNVETNWSPDLDELEAAIAYAQNNPDEQSGVKLHGSDKVHWFNKIWASSNFDLPNGLDSKHQWNREQLETVWRSISPLVFDMFSRRQS